MTERTRVLMAAPEAHPSSDLQRHYRITALVISMLATLIVAGLYLNIAIPSQIAKARRANTVFAEQIARVAENAATLPRIPPELAEQVEAEMAARPVVKFRVYGGWHIRYSTDESEVGHLVSYAERTAGYTRWGRLTYFDSFDTGREILYDRNLMVTRYMVGGYQEHAGFEIYTDVTGSQRKIMRFALYAVSAIELVLAVALLVVLVRPYV